MRALQAMACEGSQWCVYMGNRRSFIILAAIIALQYTLLGIKKINGTTIFISLH